MALGGCTGAPSLNILGSYFPSWMVCALSGLGVAIVFHLIFAVTNIDKALPVPLVVYLALATAGGFATWLLWLG